MHTSAHLYASSVSPVKLLQSDQDKRRWMTEKQRGSVYWRYGCSDEPTPEL